MNIKLSEEKVRILKEEGTHFKDGIDGKIYYQYPREVYKETDNELIFELVDKVLTPIELPSDEEIRQEGLSNFPNSEYVDRSNDRLAYYVGAKWMKEQILNQSK